MSESAVDIVDDPNLTIDPITARSATSYSDSELAHFHIDENDLDKIFLKIWNPETGGHLPGKKKTISENVRAAVTDASFEDSIDETNSFTLAIHDPDWELLNTGALDHTIDINPGNIPRLWYRLLAVGVQDEDITLTFITRNAAYLSYHTKPYKVSRNKMTRALFILTMLHHVKKKGVKIKLFCPKLRIKQPIAKTKPASSKSVDARRGPGFDSKEKLQVISNAGSTSTADESQMKVLEEALQGADHVGVSPRGMVAGIMVVMIETDTGKSRSANAKYVGVFQQNPAWWPATGDVYKDGVGARGKTGFWPKLKDYLAAHPGSDLAAAGLAVQGAGDDLYAMKLNRARPYAEKVVKAWTGGAGADDTSSGLSYEFMVGPPHGPRGENYLEATHRLVDEVRWRFYWVRDVAHLISDEDLFKAKARARLRFHRVGGGPKGQLGEGMTPGGQVSAVVESVSANWDRGKPVNEMTIRVRMENWAAPMGTVVVFDEGGPLKGRWLVTSIRKSIFDSLADVTLRAPVKSKKEPAHDMRTRPTDGGDTSPSPDAGGSIDASEGAKGIVDAAAAIAEAVDSEIFVVSDLRAGDTLPSGNYSDHAENNVGRAARDIAVKGIDAISGPPNPRLDEAMKRIAEYFGFSYTKGQTVDAKDISKRGYRIQFIWRTPKYGGHMGHIHVGARKETLSPNKLYGPGKKTFGGPANP